MERLVGKVLNVVDGETIEVEIALLSGSGIAGRVTKKDLEQFIESGASVPPARTGASMHAPSGVEPHGPQPQPWQGDRVEQMSKMRSFTSDHMVLARRSAAHVVPHRPARQIIVPRRRRPGAARVHRG